MISLGCCAGFANVPRPPGPGIIPARVKSRSNFAPFSVKAKPMAPWGIWGLVTTPLPPEKAKPMVRRAIWTGDLPSKPFPPDAPPSHGMEKQSQWSPGEVGKLRIPTTKCETAWIFRCSEFEAFLGRSEANGNLGDLAFGRIPGSSTPLTRRRGAGRRRVTAGPRCDTMVVREPPQPSPIETPCRWRRSATIPRSSA